MMKSSSESSGTGLGDLLLPAAVLVIVGIMIFPLPVALLDVLLALNITFSLCLLLSAVYLSEPQRFTALPSMLLLATLFRLGLNISTTRQILSEGTAPEIVSAFGSFVVRGNYLIGGVLFAIITVVQFLVIAKGAERVAEVAARFTLDAMPGKQMAIDADIRNGSISLAEARQRRRELQQESRLYGALDGAMKFVKGDAVAGLLITAVNLVAGFAAGVLQQGLSLATAAERYTLFTIGDGLVSQLPALLVAVAAGIAVTRVADVQSQLIGREMAAQLSEHPQALSATAVVLCVLAVLPGLPALPFLASALVLQTAAGMVKLRGREAEQRREAATFRPGACAAFTLVVTKAAAARLEGELQLPAMVRELRSSIFQQWGVLVADPELKVVEDGSGTPAARLLCRGTEVDRISTMPEAPPAADAQHEDAWSRAVCSMLRVYLQRRLPSLVDDTHTRTLFEVHQAACEDLINAVVPDMISLTNLTAVLRQLVREEVTIRNLPGILQAVAEWKQCTGSTGEGALAATVVSELDGTRRAATGLLAHVRAALRHAIYRSLCPDGETLVLYALDARLDELIANAALAGIPLAPEIVTGLQAAAKERASSRRLVLLTSSVARLQVFLLLSAEIADLHVLAPEELEPGAELRVAGVLSLGGGEEKRDGVMPQTRELEAGSRELPKSAAIAERWSGELVEEAA